MDQTLKDWVIRYHEQLEPEAKSNFLHMLKFEPDQILRYMTDNYRSWGMSAAIESRKPGVRSLADVLELLPALHEHFKTELKNIPETEMMEFRYRGDLPYWLLPCTRFQAFDKGEVIEGTIPVSWKLMVGDRLEYEVDLSISGVAEVTHVDCNETRIPDPNAESGDDEPEWVPAVTCKFKKIS